MRFIALILILIAPTWALGTTKFDNWTYSDLPPIEVFVQDEATGGCWTNIGEVQTYTEDKLRMYGAKISRHEGVGVSPEVIAREAAILQIHVKASRNKIGFCWGMVLVDLVIGATVDDGHGLFEHNGIFTYATTAATLMRNENVNNDILDLVGRIVPRWGGND